MCIACGACVAADPTLELRLDPGRQQYQPSAPGNQAAAEVCPAIAVDFAGLQVRRFPGATVTEHGVVDAVLLAQSTDRERNLAASSGGLIKELLRWYLARPDVDGAIALTHVDGLRYEPRLLRRVEEVDRLPGSIYHNLPLDNALRLLREQRGRFVLVAIPCQLEGVLTYIYRREPALADRIHTTIGLICGWNYTHHALRAICRYKRIDFDRVTGVSYRGGGPVGKLRIVTPDGTAAVDRRVDPSYQVAFDRSFNVQRCHLCINHTNFLADVVVGDAWLPSTVGTRSGISIVITRTPEGTAVLRAMTEQGAIRAIDGTTDDIVESQSRRIVFGDFSYAYADYLGEIGEHRPEMTGPNRPAARLVPRREIERFHRRLAAKHELQRRGRYGNLWLRKATLELPPTLMRYLRWFVVRVLKVKSLLGLRREVARKRLADFR
jgi:coenzyme F420 hydrogenase subunit beta